VDRPREFLHGGIGRTRAEDGVAELSLEALRTLRWRERNSGGSHRFRAEVVLPFVGGAPSADLGDDPTRDGPVTLVLPDTGTVEVHVECADGTPAGDGVRVRAWGWPPGGEDEALLDVAVVGGRAMLALVGLGLELRLSAGPEDHSRATAWTEILGPTYPGERVKAQLRLGPEATRVRLLAVDELGAPIPRAVLSGTVRVREPGSEHDTQFRFDADTDEAGGAAFRLDGFPAGQRESSLRIETSCTSEAKALHRLQAELPSPALRAGRENELGTIVLRGPPPSHPGIVLATGTVVDDATGAPLASARVNLSGDYLDDESAWIRSVDTGIDGGFELRGPPGLANLQLQAFAREHEPAGSPVVSGGNVLLRLKREVRFEARVLLEPELPRRYLQFLLISEHLSVEGEIHDLERVRFRPPEPGEYSFEVRTSDGAWLVERIEGIRVGAPETHPFAPATDPRLDPLDLRGRIVLALFRLRAAGGQALAGRVVRVRIDAGEPMRVRTDEDGRLVLVVPARARLELEPEGFQPLVCAPDREERTLDFSPR
jgi:hypothetical protein